MGDMTIRFGNVDRLCEQDAALSPLIDHHDLPRFPLPCGDLAPSRAGLRTFKSTIGVSLAIVNNQRRASTNASMTVDSKRRLDTIYKMPWEEV
jgi:hypothetical protein